MTTSPVFEATWHDNTITRMSVHCEDGDLDLGRAVRMSAHAYASRKHLEVPPASAFIKEAFFEGEGGEVLATYEKLKLSDYLIEARKPAVTETKAEKAKKAKKA